ncbi:hypothetical protein ACT3CE_15780 [Marinifilum sp. RC60d5]|uniref:hypothetical protein n=1 Tax=Marinifilum sp. RC60d5 TaxID=3458414 RepID=UPI00403574E9
MKAIIYFAAALLLILSCSKEQDENLKSPEKINPDFFEHTYSNDNFKEYAINYLQYSDSVIQFSNNFIQLYGYPKWDYGDSFKYEQKMYLYVPVVYKSNNDLVGILVLSYHEEKIESKLLLNDTDFISSIQSEYELSHLFAYYEQRMFGSITAKDFRVRLPEDSKNRTKAGIMTCYYTDVLIDGKWVNTHCECIYHFTGPSSEGIDAFGNSGGGGRPSGSDPYTGGTGNPITTPDPIPEILPTPEFKNEKTGCVYDRLMLETSFMKNLIKEYVPTNSKLDLRIEIDGDGVYDDLPSNVAGRTYNEDSPKNPYHNTILIRINKDILNQSPLKLATVIAHELIHAEIYRWLAESNNKGSILNESHPGLWDEYQNKKRVGTAQHEFMTKEYVEDLTQLLQWFDRGRHSDAEYNAMACRGLEKTSAFVNTQDETAIKALQKKIKNEEGDCDDI